MMEAILSAEGLAALLALTAMEIVLGIDNVVFIAVLVSRLPPGQQAQARRIGLALALVLRVAMLLAISTLLALTQPVLTLWGAALSWRDIIFLGGGAFLIVKATHEIHIEAEGGGHLADAPATSGRIVAAVIQIAVINLVFSIDSTMTAIGMARQVPVMVAAIVLSMIAMYVAAGAVSAFIRRHPATKQLALSFLLLIGVALVAEGAHLPLDRRIVYLAIAFSVLVSAIAMAGARRRRARALRLPRRGADQAGDAAAGPPDRARS